MAAKPCNSNEAQRPLPFAVLARYFAGKLQPSTIAVATGGTPFQSNGGHAPHS
jgi:hypothetical protein